MKNTFLTNFWKIFMYQTKGLNQDLQRCQKRTHILFLLIFLWKYFFLHSRRYFAFSYIFKDENWIFVSIFSNSKEYFWTGIKTSFHNDDKGKIFIMEMTFYCIVIFEDFFHVIIQRSYKIQIQTNGFFHSCVYIICLAFHLNWKIVMLNEKLYKF